MRRLRPNAFCAEGTAFAAAFTAKSHQRGWNPSYPKVVTELQQTGELGKRCRCRPVRYLNDIVEQDHRAINGGSDLVRDSEPFTQRGERFRETRR